MKNVTWLTNMRLGCKSTFYTNLFIVMLVAFGMVMTPQLSQASGVPLNASGIYNTTADDGSKIFFISLMRLTQPELRSSERAARRCDLYRYLHEHEPIPFHHPV